MSTQLTDAQAITFHKWHDQVRNRPAYISDVFGARNNTDNARRRTCRRLIEIGQLVESKQRPGMYYAVVGMGERRYQGECPFCHLEIAADLTLPGKPSQTGWQCPTCRVPILLRKVAVT